MRFYLVLLQENFRMTQVSMKALIELVVSHKGMQAKKNKIKVEVVRRNLGFNRGRSFPLTMDGYNKAAEWRNDLITRLEKGLPTEESNKSIVLKKAVDLTDADPDVGWSKTCNSNWSTVGYQKAAYAVKYFGENTKLEEIDLIKIKEYKSHLMTLTKGKHGGAMKTSTVNKYLDALGKVMKLCHELGKYSSDKTKFPPKISKLSFDKTESSHRGFYYDKENNVHEEKDFYDACRYFGNKYLELAKLVRLGVLTGMRIMEILTLQISDINLTRKVIVIRGSHTKNGDRRQITINDEAKAIIKYFMGNRAGRQKVIQSKYPPYNKRDGEFHVWYNAKVDRLFVKVKNYLGINDDDLTFHSSRNTFIFRSLEAGVKPHQVQVIVGHKNIDTTMGYVAKQARLVTGDETAVFNHSANNSVGYI